MNRALKRCAEPNCTELTNTTRCPQHTRTNQTRTRRHYHRNRYTSDWPTISRRYRAQHPNCECENKQCKCEGHCTRTTTDVDHHIPYRLYPDHLKAAANDPSNLRALCHQCHSFKTMIEIRTVLN